MTGLLKALWAITFQPVYTRLFRRFFDAMISRETTALSELAGVRQDLHNHVHGLNVRLDALNARVADLDQQTRVMIAARWDDLALTRRMAALEERVEQNGAATVPARQPDVAESE
jgi:hypothetical protein